MVFINEPYKLKQLKKNRPAAICIYAHVKKCFGGEFHFYRFNYIIQNYTFIPFSL
jgi:hypothetical protein